MPKNLFLLTHAVLFLLLVYCLPGTSFAAGGDYVWAPYNVAVAGNQEAKASMADSQGNLILVGSTEINGTDIHIVKVNADGSGTQTAEQWNMWNFTVDGHPIHVHLVKFKVLGRSSIGGGPSGAVTTATGVEPWEDGWKDTVITYPGEVTSIAADFDINGLYVWHCHIVEHEDNEMMVPMCVGTPGVDCPAQLF